MQIPGTERRLAVSDPHVSLARDARDVAFRPLDVVLGHGLVQRSPPACGSTCSKLPWDGHFVEPPFFALPSINCGADSHKDAFSWVHTYCIPFMLT